MSHSVVTLAICSVALIAQALRLPSNPDKLWSESQIVAYMTAHPQRAYLARVLRDGGFTNAMEVGVAAGRFSEHFLKEMSSDNSKKRTWSMVEPLPNEDFVSRFPQAKQVAAVDQIEIEPSKDEGASAWASRGIGENVEKKFFKAFSTDKAFLEQIPARSLQFVYLDGAHDYDNVKLELEEFWDKMAPGAVLAGHDYCNYGEPSLECKGCANVPRCQKYTEYGAQHGKKEGQMAANEHDVVRAVQEFAQKHPELQVHHTIEDFTRESLAKDGMDYDLVVTTNRNPSWYFVLP